MKMVTHGILVKYVTKADEPLCTIMVQSEFIPRIGEKVIISKKLFTITDIMHNCREEGSDPPQSPIGTLFLTVEQ